LRTNNSGPNIDELALSFALSAGRVEYCEHHDHVLIDTMDDAALDEARDMARQYAKDHGFNEEKTAALLSAVDRICGEAAFSCPFEPCTEDDD